MPLDQETAKAIIIRTIMADLMPEIAPAIMTAPDPDCPTCGGDSEYLRLEPIIIDIDENGEPIWGDSPVPCHCRFPLNQD